MSKWNLHIGPFLFLSALLVLCILPAWAGAQSAGSGINISIPFGGDKEQMATPVKLIILITLVSLAPALLISVTSFTRIIVVFSFLRQALGLQSSPPNQVMVGLSLFLTMAVMMPVFEKMNENGLAPYLEGKMDEKAALERGFEPLRQFMFTQTRNSDLGLMLEVARIPSVDSFERLPTSVLIPAFILSELKTAFQIGFMIYIPFVVIDMVVSMILLAMGMMVLPPVIISLPFKVMLFVVVDGWDLIIGSLVKSFH